MADPLPRDAGGTWSDPALVAAMRREEPAALQEFYVRFAPLLARCARAWGVSGALRDDVVADVLGDVALALMRHTTPVPRSVAAYLVTSLRHRLGAAHRADARRARRAAHAADEPGARSDAAPAAGADAPQRWVGHALCSEHARRAAAGAAWTPPAPHPALAALAHHLEGGLREDERLLLAWLAHHVPLRTAAEWLGVSYETATKRAQRLRARLHAAALAYVDARPADERRMLRGLLQRGTGERRTTTSAGAIPHHPADTESAP